MPTIFKTLRARIAGGARRAGPGEKSRLDTLCEFAPMQGSQAELVLWFLSFVDWIRPTGERSVETRVRYLSAQLERHPEWRANVAKALSRVVERCDISALLSSAGIPRDFHLAGALVDWAVARALPAACETRDATQIVTMAFRDGDKAWLVHLSSARWMLDLIDPILHDRLRTALATALIDLSHEVVSQAHSAGLRGLADLERSPFRGLYEAVSSLNRMPHDTSVARALAGRVEQCIRVVEAQRAGLAERGASLNTTFQLLRLRRQLRRLALLSGLRHDPSPARIWSTLGELIEQALRGAAGSRLLRGSSTLLVQNLVDSSAAVGRDYLDPEHSSTRAAFQAGAGGGALMALATGLKFALAGLHLPRLYEGLAFSLNYASVFCAAYLLHFTIATKLPAHTAAALARDLQRGTSFRVRLAHFSHTWRAMVRLQLVGLLGNVLLVAPLAALLALLCNKLQLPLLGPDKARHVLDAQSLLGPSVAFAALTGGMLWVSSLVGAFVDNWARVTQLSDRLATSVRALRRAAPARARERAERFTRKLGGFASNVTLGCLLGGVPAAFALAEIPIEIRHVTVSVGSLAMAAVTGVSGTGVWALAIAGVACVGIMNVLVSFWLALWFALTSARSAERGASAAALMTLGIRRWARPRARDAALAAPIALEERR